MQLRRAMIAAPKSGSGKTMITCALLQALKNRGEKVLSYKCGPDYIDPMFHELQSWKELWDCLMDWVEAGKRVPPIIWQK